MTTHFQQQSPAQNLNLVRSVPSQQHGAKPRPEAAAKVREPRSFEPKPGRS